MTISGGCSYVVDSNVLINANGGEQAEGDEQCRKNCDHALRELSQRAVVAVDERRRILKEYEEAWRRFPGPTGSGFQFYKHISSYLWDERRVRQIAITEAGDDRGFGELPVNDFDRSDRKFLAVAREAGAEVLNSTDSDWREHGDLMDFLGVKVQQLCPCQSSRS